MTEQEIIDLVEDAKKQGFIRGRNRAAMVTVRLKLVEATKEIMALSFNEASATKESA